MPFFGDTNNLKSNVNSFSNDRKENHLIVIKSGSKIFKYRIKNIVTIRSNHLVNYR